jgi:hypothetical protein
MRRRLDYPQSGVRGVTWHARKRRWVVYARIEGRNRYYGSFLLENLAAAIAKRRQVEQRYPELTQHGLAQRRYPAPLGQRACANPDCTGGLDADGQPCRYVGPESSYPKGGAYRKSVCRVCHADAMRPKNRRRYQQDPSTHRRLYLSRQARLTAKRLEERDWRGQVVQTTLGTLRTAGWTRPRIAAAIGVSLDCVENWSSGRRIPLHTQAFESLLTLAQAVKADQHAVEADVSQSSVLVAKRSLKERSCAFLRSLVQTP